ncbi:uncharacterized protein FIESC28_04346 [Fusarium coffeatum]|uniref:Transcription factor domain-containing protein n=1 Tax=Fusarium coffeatum TaxID=231269 RepID=A0A366S0C7_9HYPO|nr:uncharacterized protein FIESC28_04346 [Fusarium coffeatum]RBR22783.1 hypothetical protein FIESC28_04346 [Fusarium coffeatum]
MTTLPDPPYFSQQSQSTKRKRLELTEDDDFPSSFPASSINPLSHSPGLVAQFAIAGLSETDENPSQHIRDFPHRGFPSRSTSAAEPESDEDPETEGDEAARPKSKKATNSKRSGHFDVLLQSCHHFVDQGEIEKASRTYSLLLQLRPTGLPIDVRHHNLWAIGAEILMREGENAQHEEARETKPTTKRWGRAENMNKVKAYFDTLIQQHPYDSKMPNIVSAVDFWIAMFSCEIYNIHAEHVLLLERLIHDTEEESFQESFGHDDNFGSDDTDSPETRLIRRKDELRLQSLSAMQDVTKRMDELIRELPYSKNPHYLRLRAMASLYLADLVVPISSASMLQTEQAQQARSKEQSEARRYLERMVNEGGELDSATLNVLNPSDDSEGDTSLSLYNSLPIRGL